MPEADTVHPDASPLTVHTLAEQLRACGLAPGQTVLVHSAMSKLGWVCGGPVAVIGALLEALGPTGTLMMPTHTTGNTDPSNWENPSVPEAWWETIRASMPAFDPRITPTRQMGRIAELFRTYPGVVRSAHPIGSFAALGPNAEKLTETHALEEEFGDASPLGTLYALDGYILLLGVGHENNTSLHLAEYRTEFPGKTFVEEGAAMLKEGERRWVTFQSLDWEPDDFGTLGDAYEKAHEIRRHPVGRAEARFMKQRPLVDWAVRWMEENRTDSEVPGGARAAFPPGRKRD